MGLGWSTHAGVTPGGVGAMERMDAPSLRELAALAVRDDNARDVLLARVRDMALRYSRVRLGRFGAEDTAQDVAQEVCMAVMTALPTYQERGLPFEAFVYTITSRKLADAQRAAMRGPAPVADVPDGPDDGPSPESVAVMRDDAATAMALMQQLPDAAARDPHAARRRRHEHRRDGRRARHVRRRRSASPSTGP